jgi:hypothetical protein
MFPMPPEDQVPRAGHRLFELPDWKDLMLKFAERMPARKALIDRFVYGKCRRSAARAGLRAHRSTCCGASILPPARDPSCAWCYPGVGQGRQQRRAADDWQHDEIVAGCQPRATKLLDMLKASVAVEQGHASCCRR